MEEYIVKNQKKLRKGITTGTCAAAAAQAATMHLLCGTTSSEVMLRTPNGTTVRIPVYVLEASEQAVGYRVVKDSGDDPDVTNGADVCVTVEYDADADTHGTGACEAEADACPESGDTSRNSTQEFFTSEQYPYLSLDGGIGIGRVTEPGMEQKVGQAAINRVPRQMIFAAVGGVCELAGRKDKLRITVWMPEGESLAKRTFNPKLGIRGGLSILGTSGILEPMSEQAIVATIEAEIRRLSAIGRTRILVMPGNYGQAYASEYLGLDLTDSVKCSNYIGETLDLAIAYGMKEFLLVGNIGKLVKLAAGIFNTHSKVADGRGEIFACHAAMVGAPPEVVRELYACINTDRMLAVLEREHMRDAVMQSIRAGISRHIADRVREEMRVRVEIFSEQYGYLGCAGNMDYEATETLK